jgi:ClpP class serine protease
MKIGILTRSCRKYTDDVLRATALSGFVDEVAARDEKRRARSEVNDADKNGLMTVVHQLDRSKGLDLLLHTPGGETAATESFVDYLRSIFGKDIRAFIPQLALSAGTMIACACKEIYMGKQSSLGPVDPQFVEFLLMVLLRKGSAHIPKK